MIKKMKLVKYAIFAIILFVVSLLINGYCDKKSSVQLNYNEQQNINYKVYLTDDTFYNAKYLNEGMQYISSIINYIDVDFNHKVIFEDIINYDVNTKIMADINIVDKANSDKIIYNSEELLFDNSDKVKNSNVIDVSKNIKIDYKKYNKIANEFKTNYGISANCSLVVKFYVNYEGSYKKNDAIKNSSVGTLEIPLSEQMINIDKSNDINNSLVYNFTNVDSVGIKILKIISVILYVACIVMLIIFLIKIIKISNTRNKYDVYIRKILRQYDAYIAETKSVINETGKTVIKCNSFKELMDVRNNIEKAIIYVKINKFNSKFLLIDNNEIYSYQVSSSDFNKRKV